MDDSYWAYPLIVIGASLIIFTIIKTHWPEAVKSTKQYSSPPPPPNPRAASGVYGPPVGGRNPLPNGMTSRGHAVPAATTHPVQPPAFDNSSAPPYPKEVKVKLPDVAPSKGWLCLKASVKGFEKEELQDAHAVRFDGSIAVLVVADGQSRKKHSKEAADLSVELVADRLAKQVAAGTITAATWGAEAKEAFMAANEALVAKAKDQDVALTEFACTLIAVVATEQGVHCAHVGDGRAGYLDADAVFRPLLVPFKDKDGESNATVFLTMLTSDTVDRFLQCQSVPVRSRCLVALSDGPESVCWHTATQDKAGKGKIEDPNMPSGEFFEKIAGQLAGASSNNVTQEDLDKLWTDFLTSGNPALKAEKDDKTLVLALRG